MPRGWIKWIDQKKKETWLSKLMQSIRAKSLRKKRIKGMPMVTKKIRDVMEAKGVTAHELSMRTGLRIETIYRLINGSTRRPPFETVSKVAAALGLRLEELRAATSDEPVGVE